MYLATYLQRIFKGFWSKYIQSKIIFLRSSSERKDGFGWLLFFTNLKSLKSMQTCFRMALWCVCGVQSQSGGPTEVEEPQNLSLACQGDLSFSVPFWLLG